MLEPSVKAIAPMASPAVPEVDPDFRKILAEECFHLALNRRGHRPPDAAGEIQASGFEGNHLRGAPHLRDRHSCLRDAGPGHEQAGVARR